MTFSEAEVLTQKYFAKFSYLLGLTDVVTRGKDIRGARAGCAITQKVKKRGEVRFNLALLAHSGSEADIRNTVAHELCHIRAEIDSSARVHHGWAWKRLMLSLNELPERTHNLDVPVHLRRAITRYLYRCPDCDTDFWLSGRRHNNKQRGEYEYNCRSCSTGIVFTGRSEKRKRGQK